MLQLHHVVKENHAGSSMLVNNTTTLNYANVVASCGLNQVTIYDNNNQGNYCDIFGQINLGADSLNTKLMQKDFDEMNAFLEGNNIITCCTFLDHKRLAFGTTCGLVYFVEMEPCKVICVIDTETNDSIRNLHIFCDMNNVHPLTTPLAKIQSIQKQHMLLIVCKSHVLLHDWKLSKPIAMVEIEGEELTCGVIDLMNNCLWLGTQSKKILNVNLNEMINSNSAPKCVSVDPAKFDSSAVAIKQVLGNILVIGCQESLYFCSIEQKDSETIPENLDSFQNSFLKILQEPLIVERDPAENYPAFPYFDVIKAYPYDASKNFAKNTEMINRIGMENSEKLYFAWCETEDIVNFGEIEKPKLFIKIENVEEKIPENVEKQTENPEKKEHIEIETAEKKQDEKIPENSENSEKQTEEPKNEEKEGEIAENSEKDEKIPEKSEKEGEIAENPEKPEESKKEATEVEKPPKKTFYNLLKQFTHPEGVILTSCIVSYQGDGLLLGTEAGEMIKYAVKGLKP